MNMPPSMVLFYDGVLQLRILPLSPALLVMHLGIYRWLNADQTSYAKEPNEHRYTESRFYFSVPHTCKTERRRFTNPSPKAKATPRNVSHFSYDLTFLRSSCRH
jgi:hypothetical protein